MSGQHHMDAGTRGGSSGLPSSRLRTAGPAGVSAQRWPMAAAIALVVVCGGALVAAWLMPLDERAAVAQGAGATLPTVVLTERSMARPSAAARAAMVDELRRADVFAVERRAAASAVADDAGSAATPAERSPSRPAPDEPVRIEVTAVEDAKPDLRSSYELMTLRGYYRERDGALVAQISQRHTASPLRAQAVRAGAAFELRTSPDRNKKAEEWTLMAVDPARRRVIVSRSGVNFALPLFGSGPADLSPLVAQSAEPVATTPVEVVVIPEGPDTLPRVERQSQAEALAEIRRKAAELEADGSISIEDLAELMRLTNERPTGEDPAGTGQQQQGGTPPPSAQPGNDPK